MRQTLSSIHSDRLASGGEVLPDLDFEECEACAGTGADEDGHDCSACSGQGVLPVWLEGCDE